MPRLVVSGEHLLTLRPTTFHLFPIRSIWKGLDTSGQIIDTIKVRPVFDLIEIERSCELGIIPLVMIVSYRWLPYFKRFSGPDSSIREHVSHKCIHMGQVITKGTHQGQWPNATACHFVLRQSSLQAFCSQVMSEIWRGPPFRSKLRRRGQ